MAKSNYSAGKRQRERDKARRKQDKIDRQRQKRETGGPDNIPIADVSDIQGGLKSIDEVMRSMDPSEATEPVSHGTPCRLFVGGVSWRTTTDDLKRKLEEYGPVVDALIVVDRDTGESRGFGFVTMGDSKDAAQAIRGLDGQDFDGRTLVVRRATERR